MRTHVLILSLLRLAGCARTPPVTINYQLARSSLHARVVRTVGCDAANMPVVANTVTTEVRHTADPSPGQTRSTELWRVDGALANNELKTDFYGDGRLKSINATTTGQGETIFKTAIKIAELAGEAQLADRTAIEQACKDLKTAFADKVLTLVFDRHDELAADQPFVTIPPEATSAAHFRKYRVLLGDTCLQFGDIHVPTAGPVSSAADSLVTIKARQPALLALAVTTGPPGKCAQTILWSALVQASQHGKEYQLPIPRAALFGKQVFAASFDEAGALTQLQYNKDTGIGQALGVAQALGAAATTTDAEQAAALKSEADVIAAQQRLIRCQIEPASC